MNYLYVNEVSNMLCFRGYARVGYLRYLSFYPHAFPPV